VTLAEWHLDLVKKGSVPQMALKKCHLFGKSGKKLIRAWLRRQSFCLGSYHFLQDGFGLQPAKWFHRRHIF
jgi:hypothetical protein